MSEQQRDKIMRRIYAERGLAARIARELGLHAQAVQQWKRVPPAHVWTLAPLLDMTPEEIRPDIFKPLRKGDRPRR